MTTPFSTAGDSPPEVSVLLPVRNEERFIAACLRSALDGLDRTGVAAEILVIDGESTDRTCDLVKNAAEQDHRIRLLTNPGRISPVALNIGIRHARGSIIIRLDGHATYPLEYFAECLASLARCQADNVGGLFVTRARGTTAMARALAATTSLPIGVGGGFRTAAPSGYADTVPFGCFRREVFDRFGLFDERLIRGQDYEFNRRMARLGGRIWRNSTIRVGYFQIDRLGVFLRKQLLLQGPGVAAMWWLAPWAITPRHLAAPLLVVGAATLGVLARGHHSAALLLGVGAFFYEAVIVLNAVREVKSIGRTAAALLPLTVTLYHLAYGTGILAGLIAMPFRLLSWNRWRRPWDGASSFRALSAVSR